MKHMKNLLCQCPKRLTTLNWREVTLPVTAAKQTLKGGIRNDKESVLDCCVGCTTRGRDSEAKAAEVWLSPVDMYDVTPMFMERELQSNIWNLMSNLSCK